MVDPELLLLISRESSLFMRLCLQVVFTVEESLNSVWPFLKDLAGTLLTIAMPNHISLVKVKVALSYQLNVVAGKINLKNSVLTMEEAVHHMVDLAEDAAVMETAMDAKSTIQMLIMTVKILMLLIMQDFLIFNPLEELLEANALLEI